MDHGSFGRFGLPLLSPLVLKTIVIMVKTVVIVVAIFENSSNICFSFVFCI